MVLWKSLKSSQATLPLRLRIDASFVELVQQLVGILLSEFIVEFALELSVDQRMVFLALSPLLLGREGSDGREKEWLGRHELSGVLVIPQVKFKIELTLRCESLTIRPLLEQMLHLSTVSSVIEIEHRWSIGALSALSTLQDLIEE